MNLNFLSFLNQVSIEIEPVLASRGMDFYYELDPELPEGTLLPTALVQQFLPTLIKEFIKPIQGTELSLILSRQDGTVLMEFCLESEDHFEFPPLSQLISTSKNAHSSSIIQDQLDLAFENSLEIRSDGHCLKIMIPLKQGEDSEDLELRIPDLPGTWDSKLAMDRIFKDKDLYRVIIQMFLSNFEQYFMQLENAVEREEVEMARDLSHKIRGTASQVGASECMQISEKLERSLGQSLPKDIKLRLEILKTAFGTFKSLTEESGLITLGSKQEKE